MGIALVTEMDYVPAWLRELTSETDVDLLNAWGYLTDHRMSFCVVKWCLKPHVDYSHIGVCPAHLEALRCGGCESCLAKLEKLTSPISNRRNWRHTHLDEEVAHGGASR